jgi:nucleotide-binding universal stress UspA family protein
VKTIVVGFDGSEAATRALERAAELAEALSARLVVVSVERSAVAAPVVEPEAALAPSPLAAAIASGQMPRETGPAQPEPEELARRRLEQARMVLTRRRVEAEYVAELGSAAERLLEIAAEREADLLVVGSPHHGLLERLLARPVDEAVARRANRDVLLVH